MKTLGLYKFLRLKFKVKVITRANDKVKAIDAEQEQLSASQKRVQAYCECPLHPLK
ncbi:hypothetical protein LVD17_23070 [Fulvivirga ulvae]|uniref:hypothetical protein n=1 Tax=Fulvivirga ulvae TaxID=2904245 RepID=UPI001F34F366|nr:hypothetical protein [Fulvivirga ulvae]UII31177.1 hypothetical protein LVD17_23070 [Fulvivirga ulvae]